MTDDEFERVVALACFLRRDWIPASTRQVLAPIRDRPFAETAHAVLECAIDPATATPARITRNGPHWASRPGAKPPAPSPVRALSSRDPRPRCPVHGEDYAAATCQACRSEWIAGRLPAGSRYDTESDPRRRTA